MVLEIEDAPTKYRYYVAYLFKQNGNFGHGWSEISRSSPIETFDDIKSVVATLEDHIEGGEGTTIVNWKRLQ